MEKPKHNYVIGGWTQHLDAVPPPMFSYAMYGMVTNYPDLTTGTAESPGWSPADVEAPDHPHRTVMWTYGGGGGAPTGTPSSEAQMNDIVNATLEKNWAGVDFDNESDMNIENVAKTTLRLKKFRKESSYSFLAGWSYNHSGQEVENVKFLAEHAAMERFVLLCYAASMWSMDDITANVGPAIEQTLALGVPPKKAILALTHRGLTQENLDYFLDQVLQHEIGGLFIWEYPSLSDTYLNYICEKLQIGQPC